MKRFLRTVLTVIAMVTVVTMMAGLMTGCGNTNTESTPTGTAGNAGNSSNNSNTEKSVFPKALADLSAIQLDSLADTGWELAGGIFDDTEMEQTDVDAVLEAFGGKLQFVFTDDSHVQLVDGEGSVSGTYEIVESGYAVHAVFPDNEYYGVYSIVDDWDVLIVVNSKDSEKALYMTPISEY